MYIVNTTCHKMIILGILVAFYFVLYMHMYVEMIPVFRSIILFFSQNAQIGAVSKTLLLLPS